MTLWIIGAGVVAWAGLSVAFAALFRARRARAESGDVALADKEFVAPSGRRAIRSSPPLRTP